MYLLCNINYYLIRNSVRYERPLYYADFNGNRWIIPKTTNIILSLSIERKDVKFLDSYSTWLFSIVESGLTVSCYSQLIYLFSILRNLCKCFPKILYFYSKRSLFSFHFFFNVSCMNKIIVINVICDEPFFFLIMSIFSIRKIWFKYHHFRDAKQFQQIDS